MIVNVLLTDTSRIIGLDFVRTHDSKKTTKGASLWKNTYQ